MDRDYLHTASNQILKWEWPVSETNHDCATSGMCDIVGRAVSECTCMWNSYNYYNTIIQDCHQNVTA